MGIGRLLLGAGTVIGGIVLAPVVLPAAAAAGTAAAVAAGSAATAAAGVVATAGTAVASSAVGTAVGAGMAAVGGTVGTIAGAAGVSSVATIAGTSAGATALGAITTSAAVGVTGAASGINNMTKASEVKQQAEEIYDQERKKFDKVEASTNKELEELGKIKIKIWERFAEFEEVFSRIQNLVIDGEVKLEKELKLDVNMLQNVHLLAMSAKEVIKDGVISLSSGQLIGAAASTGITSMATASTGTAIASLHGAAASNAALAALGGGSLEVGGLGMAGGAVVSNALVFAPALAVGGLFINSHGKKSLKAAEGALSESKKLVVDLKEAEKQLEELQNITKEMSKVLQRYDKIFVKLLAWLWYLIEQGTDANYYTEELTKCYASYRIVEILYDLTTTELYSTKDNNAILHAEKVKQVVKECDERWDEYKNVA